jgi:hypothetical protein
MSKIVADGLHKLGWDEGGVTEIEHFDFDEVDRRLGNEPEPGISFADASAALSVILEWSLKAHTLKDVGARIAALAHGAGKVLVIVLSLIGRLERPFSESERSLCRLCSWHIENPIILFG